MTNLPEGWEIRRLEDLCEPGKQAIVDGPFGSNLKRSDYVDNGIPVLKIQNIKENLITLKKMDYVSPDKYQELVRHSFTEGDIVMTKLGDPLGVSAIVNGIPNGLIVADLVRIRPSKVLTKFLCYQLNSPRIQKYINEQQKGTTRPRVNLAMIRELPIYTPPIEEQHKIVDFLEDHLSRLDAALVDVKQAKIKAAQFRRSLLQAAFTGNLALNEPNLRTEIPGEWRQERFGDIFKVKYGKAIDKSLRMEFAEFPVVGSAGIMTYTKTPLTTEPTIVIGRKGNVGSIQIFKAGCYPIDTTYYMPTTSDFDIDFLTYQLTSLELVKLDSSTATPSLRREDLENVQLVIPPIEEQLKIVALIKNHLSMLDSAVQSADAMEKQSNGLRRSLLQAAFTGQLTNEVVSV
jgi:type I restriction enzyme, S subunit